MAIQGAKSLLNRLYKLQQAVEKDVPNAIRSEVDDRRHAVEQGFAAVSEEEHDVTVSAGYGTVGTDERYWDIIAEGNDVLFVEYGTGINTVHKANNFGGQSFEPGSWSRTHSQYLTDPKKVKAHRGQWPYGGKWVDGIGSKNIMYDASKMLRIKFENGTMTKSVKEALK